LFLVGSTDRVGGGGATFTPLNHPGALLPLSMAIASLDEIFPQTLAVCHF
jgi:hypothetical protein